MDPQLITLIINAVLGIFILFGFLGGLKGIKKSTFSLCMFILQLIVVFFLTPVVSKMILNISIEGSTINQHISTAITDALGADVASNDFVKDLIANIPLMVVNIVTTILLLLVLKLVFKIIGAIVYRLFFGKDNVTEVEKCEIVNGTPQMVKTTVKKKKHRLAGGLVGAVHGFLFALAMFLPICGLVNIFNDVAGVNQVSAETEQTESTELKPIKDLIQESVPQEVLEYAKAINNSIIYKVGTVANISETSFNLVTNTTINGKNVKLGEEIRAIVNTYDSFVDFATTSSSSLESFSFEAIFEDLKNNPQNYDFNKLYGIIDKLFESNLINAMGKDGLKLAADLLVESAQDETTLKYLTHVKNAIYSYASTNATLKDDIKAFVGVIEVCLKSDLIKTLEQENITLNDVKAILLNEESASKQENDVLKQILNKATSSVLLQKFVLEFTNLGISELQSLMNENLEFNDGNNVVLTTIDSTKDYSLSTTELENLVVNSLSLYEKIENLDYEVIEQDFYEIFNANLEGIISNAGTILENVVSLSILKDTGVFASICDAMAKTEYNQYVNFALLKTAHTIETQFGYLAESVGVLNNSGIVSIIRYANEENMDETISSVMKKLAEKPDGSTNNETYVSKIVSPLLKCTLFKNALVYGLDVAGEYIQTGLQEKNPDAIINKFNTEDLMTENENANIIAVLNNLVVFASNVNFDNLLSDNLIDELMANENNFVYFGNAMDSIQSSTLFKDYEENGQIKEGVYKCLMDALSGIEGLNNFFDFSVAKANNFSWTDTASKLQTLSTNLKEVTVLDGEEELTLIKYMLSSTADYSTLLDKIQGKTIELTELFQIDLLKPTSVQIVNLINSTIKDFVNNEGATEEEQIGKNIVDITLSANLYDQATSINEVINKALQIDFETLDINNIDKENELPKIKALLEAMEANANLVDTDGNFYGVFKESYRALTIKLVNVINEEISTFVGNSLKLGIQNYNANSSISVNLTNLMNIIEKSLDLELSSELSIKTLDKTKLNDLLDSIQADAMNINSAFSVSYNAIMLKMVNLINQNVASIVGENAGSNITTIQTPINVSYEISSLRTMLNNVIDVAQSGTFDTINVKTLDVNALFNFIDLFKNNSTLAGGAFAATENALLVFIINTINQEVANAVGADYNSNIVYNYNGDATPDYTATKTLLNAAVNAFKSLEEGEGLEDLEADLQSAFIEALTDQGISQYTENTKTAIENYLLGQLTQ